MIRGIHHVGINCRDMARMQKFYGDAFGFKPVGEGFGWGLPAEGFAGRSFIGLAMWLRWRWVNWPS